MHGITGTASNRGCFMLRSREGHLSHTGVALEGEQNPLSQSCTIHGLEISSKSSFDTIRALGQHDMS